MPKISVIVPVYNAEKYLGECINSILKQTFSDFELILVNDGSTDNSQKICEKYAQMDDRVIIFNQPNSGVSAARNMGIDHCCGEYITFVDSDDTIDQSFLAYALQSIMEADVDAFISGLKMEWWADNKITKIDQYGIEESNIYSIKVLFEKMNVTYPQICICGPCCKLYRAQIIRQRNIRFVDFLDYGEDTYFNLDYFAHCKAVLFSHVCFYQYRRVNGESLFSRFHKDTYEVHNMVYSKMRALMAANDCNEEAVMRFEVLYLFLLIGGVHEYYRYSEKTTNKERLQQIMKVAEDPHISEVKWKYVHGLKNKVLFFLFRYKLYKIIAFFFKVKYGLR